MTKKALILAFAGIFSMASQAQLVQLPNGNLELQPSGAPTSSWAGNTHFLINTNRTAGLYVDKYASSGTSNWQYAIQGVNRIYSGQMSVGLRAYVTDDVPRGTGRAFGVIGAAGNSTSGYNYGVMGCLFSAQNGAAVYGAVGDWHFGSGVSGRYGGYFEGNVRATGVMTATNFTTSSDIRFKKNIQDLRSKRTSILENLEKLNPVEYDLQQVYVDAISNSDSTVQKRGLFIEEDEMMQKKHFGLIAQEVQEVYPNLVYEDGEGYLSIDYIGLIPVLIESAKELSDRVKTLENELIVQKNASLITTGLEADAAQAVAWLGQNTPNPFSTSTEISYFIPEIATTAALIFYDLQGKEMLHKTISQRGEGVYTVSGSQLTPGIYLYGLIVDGETIDIKRMIVTSN